MSFAGVRRDANGQRAELEGGCGHWYLGSGRLNKEGQLRGGRT